MLFVLALLNPASARCVPPNSVFAVDATLPTDPTVYFFQTRGAAPVFSSTDGAGRSLEVVAERAPSPKGFVAWRLQIDTLDDSDIRLSAKVGDLAPITHKAKIVPRAPFDPSAAELLPRGETSAAWTCSHTRTANIDVKASHAAAFRVEFASTLEALQSSPQSVVVPDDVRRFVSHRQNEGPRLELGHLNCLGESFSWEAGDQFIRVTTLLSNGAEALPSEPMFVAAPDEASTSTR